MNNLKLRNSSVYNNMKGMEILRNELPKRSPNMFSKTTKHLFKEIKEYPNKYKDMLCSYIFSLLTA